MSKFNIEDLVYIADKGFGMVTDIDYMQLCVMMLENPFEEVWCIEDDLTPADCSMSGYSMALHKLDFYKKYRLQKCSSEVVTNKSLSKAIKMLTEEYTKAQSLTHINKPLSYALYQTWKYFDQHEKLRGDNKK